MEPTKHIPQMEPFLSVEERMKLILSVIKHAKITFTDAYKLSNLELTTLSKLIEEENTNDLRVLGDTDYWEDSDSYDEPEPEPLRRSWGRPRTPVEVTTEEHPF